MIKFGSSHIEDRSKVIPFYMKRYFLGRAWLHIFYRGDLDSSHDHPHDFWTFPLQSYVEEVAEEDPNNPGTYILRRVVVERFRLHYRPAEYTHRILGKFAHTAYDVLTYDTFADVSGSAVNNDDSLEPYYYTSKPFVTLVWRGDKRRSWGFLKSVYGKWCWVPWKDYVSGEKKTTPCED